ncbi:hypothetical protein NW768_004880 [Fusarium equiseti]|uniref:Uncharacterized protein n=1 Tax=Fusarium equiseti TaxID=61235 RepID=A0ABQ8RHG4_FUSEQ|nr:hypothetical protein NW768_004880 [Fusarium equiseti]
MALDPIKYGQKKVQDNLVAHTGAWTQATGTSPAKPVTEGNVQDSKNKAEKKN